MNEPRLRAVAVACRELARRYVLGPARQHSDVLDQVCWQVVDLLDSSSPGFALAPRKVVVRLHPDDYRKLREQIGDLRGRLGPRVRLRVAELWSRPQRPPVRFPPGFEVAATAVPTTTPGKPECPRADLVWERRYRFAFLAAWHDRRRARPVHRLWLDGEVTVNRQSLRRIARGYDNGISSDVHAVIRVLRDGTVEIDPRGTTEVDGRPLDHVTRLAPSPSPYPVRFSQTKLQLYWADEWESAVWRASSNGNGSR